MTARFWKGLISGSHRIPLILQTEAAECGLACLAMVGGYFGWKTDLNRLRREHTISLKGATLKTIIDVAERHGLLCRALRAELLELRFIRTPAIIHWDLNHFVVLKTASKTSAVILDPAVGERHMPWSKVSQHFTGVVLEITPSASFSPTDNRERLRIRELLGGAIGLKRSLAQLLVISLTLQFMALLSPFYLQLVIDEGVTRFDDDLLAVLAVGFSAVLLLQICLSWTRSWTVIHLGTVLGVQLQSNLFNHMLRLPLRFFYKRHLGDIMSRFGSLGAVQNLFTTGIIEAVVDSAMLIFTCGAMFLYAPGLAATTAILLLIYGVARWARYHSIRGLAAENLRAAAENGSHFMETLRAINTIKLCGLERERLDQWQSRLVDTTNTSLQMARHNLGFSTANKALFGLGHILIVFLGAQLVLDNAMTVGMLLAFLAYQGQFLSAGGTLVDQWIAFKLVDIHIDRLSDVALSQPEEVRGSGQPLLELPSAVTLENISFRYATEEPFLLNNVSFHVRDGDCAVILGASGTGKSTLLRIIAGLERPEQGYVRIGGVDITKVGLRNHRRTIGAVTQDDRLLAGSIAENITVFDRTPDIERMLDCARICGIHEVIMAMPMNYHSLIGDMGDSLSAGEKQRLLLARALYRRPRILLLDEATSNLDPENDERIHRMLAAQKITRIIATHRHTPLRFAQQIFRLTGGGCLHLVASPEELPEPLSAA